MPDLPMDNPLEPLPWQKESWQQLCVLNENGRLPHALLLSGPLGIGKRHFAEAFAQRLLCLTPDTGHACGQCKSCRLVATGGHPDRQEVIPEQPGKAIRVDQIRGLADFFGSAAQQGGYRVLIIEPADEMNVNAANALLKSLEEPGLRTLFLLLTHRPGRLMPTIRSRCQHYHLAVPERTMAAYWLESRLEGGTDTSLLLSLASGAPLRALALANTGALANRQQSLSQLEQLLRRQLSPSDLAGQWAKENLLERLEWMQSLQADLVRCLMAGGEGVQNSDALPLLERLAPLTLEQRLFEFSDKMQEYRVYLLGRSNPNPQLMWEDLLIRWRSMFHSSRKRTH